MSEKSENFALRRRAIVKAILAERGDALVIGGLGSAAWDITDAGDTPLNFPLWGAMGGTVAIALGLAIAQPGRRVLALSGDGDLLMGVGSLATVAVQAPRNLAIVALDNERYGETGMQETATASGVDLTGIARACGFPLAATIRDAAGFAASLPQIIGAPGPCFFTIKVRAEKLPLVLPPKDGTELKQRFRRALLGTS
jgi:thiamine pyrophosphate-dependent acetolactate synthase large subunit-like protein